MRIETLPITEPSWCEFVSTQENATIFHHPAWANLLAECYGYRPFVLASLDEAGRVDSGIPLMDVRSMLTGHRWISLPFSDYCAPLCSSPSVLESLVEYLCDQQEKKAVPRIEIRSFIPDRPGVYHDDRYVLHTLKLLKDPEAVMKTFDRTRVRQPLKQVAQRGVEIRRATDTSDISTFYGMLVATRRRHGAPVQPRRFFDLFWDRIIGNDLGFLLLAYKDDEPVGGTVFAHYRGTLTAKYNASAPEHWHLRTNNSLTWAAIKWGCEHGFSLFDFGRTEASNRSLRDFKKGWGTIEEPLVYSSISGGAPKPAGGGLDRLVKFIIRNSPPAVCRLVGEAFYKHFA
jgi:CelD/BcsL family acetyltransferase involved in cellulose biosynthesis